MAIQGTGVMRFRLALLGQGLGPLKMYPNLTHLQLDQEEPKIANT